MMGKVKAPVIPRPKKKTEENIITLEDVKEQYQPDDYAIIFIDQYRIFYVQISEIFSGNNMVSSHGHKSNVIFKVKPFLDIYGSQKLNFKETETTFNVNYSDCSFITKTTKEEIIKSLEKQCLENINNIKDNIKGLKKELKNHLYNLRELRKIK
jgi:hypothetical protein